MNAKVRPVSPVHLIDVPATESSWLNSLHRRGDGYAGDERNVLLALSAAPELAGLVRYNEFALQVEFSRSPPWRECAAGSPWRDSDDTQMLAWLQERGINVGRASVVASTVLVVARRQAIHPVRSYLGALRWDGVPRLAGWLIDYLGAAGPAQYLAAIGSRFLISGVARIFQPGAQADHTLVLEDHQGAGKTTVVRILGVLPEWVAGSLPDVHSKDAALQLCGRWIIELSELRAIRSSQTEAIKSFLTQTVDTYRPPYAARSEQVARQCIFVGTTNETQYLRDRTGNRRFWPVRCQSIDLPALLRDRDQLWAEAVHQFQAGTQWHLSQEEIRLALDEQAEREEVTELESEVAIYLKTLRDASKGETTETTVRDVLVYGLRLDPDSSDYVERARKLGAAVSEAMERCGWRKVRRVNTPDGKRSLYRWAGQGGQDK